MFRWTFYQTRTGMVLNYWCFPLPVTRQIARVYIAHGNMDAMSVTPMKQSLLKIATSIIVSKVNMKHKRNLHKSWVNSNH